MTRPSFYVMINSGEVWDERRMIMRKHWKIHMAWILMIVMILGSMTGCGGETPDDEVVDPTVQGYYTATLYYVATEYLETGDESIEPLVPVNATMASELTEIQDRCKETLVALALVPNVPDVKMDTMVNGQMIHTVSVEDGIATVDFYGREMSGGSMEEVYLIEQVVRTLIKSFDEVEMVRFTVDGEQVDSLMGHLEANCTYGLVSVVEDGVAVELVTILEE